MATPKILSEDEIANLLEDRQNGMGLQKVAKKYGVGIPKIRRIEKENGVQVAIPEKPPTTDLQKHFLEVQDSFAIVLDDLQKTKEELLLRIGDLEKQLPTTVDSDLESLSSSDEDLSEEVDEISTKIDWQIAGNVLFAVLGIGALFWVRMQQPVEKVVYYERPGPSERPQRPSKIPEME